MLVPTFPAAARFLRGCNTHCRLHQIIPITMRAPTFFLLLAVLGLTARAAVQPSSPPLTPPQRPPLQPAPPRPPPTSPPAEGLGSEAIAITIASLVLLTLVTCGLAIMCMCATEQASVSGARPPGIPPGGRQGRSSRRGPDPPPAATEAVTPAAAAASAAAAGHGYQLQAVTAGGDYGYQSGSQYIVDENGTKLYLVQTGVFAWEYTPIDPRLPVLGPAITQHEAMERECQKREMLAARLAAGRPFIVPAGAQPVPAVTPTACGTPTDLVADTRLEPQGAAWPWAIERHRRPVGGVSPRIAAAPLCQEPREVNQLRASLPESLIEASTSIQPMRLPHTDPARHTRTAKGATLPSNPEAIIHSQSSSILSKRETVADRTTITV